MKKAILIAALAVIVMAMPAMASVQNVKVSGDIDTTWLVRDQFDLGIQDQTKQFSQNLLMTQTRLRIDADLTDNVMATVALINERVWDEDLNDVTGASTDEGANDVDLNLAYVTIKEMLYSPLSVVIGRQNFAYGNSFVIDSGGTNNVVSTGGLDGVAEDLTKRTALDAIRLILDYNPLTIDLVVAKVDANNLTGTVPHDDDVDLYGMNANYQLGDDMETVVEAYFWAKLDSSVKTGAGAKADSVYMPGVRVATNPIKGMNLSAELAWQTGNKNNPAAGTALSDSSDNIKRNALGGQVMANYMLPFNQTAQWNPVVTGVYTYVSGESDNLAPENPGENADYSGWDPMFENQAGGSIYNAIFDLSNAHILTAKAQVSPMEDVTASLQWDGIWTDKDVSNPANVGNCSGSTCFNMRQPDGTTITPRVTTNSKVGDEIGVGLVYDYTEDVQFGAKYNWFFPGAFFSSDNDQVASQVLVNGSVSF